MTQGHKLLDRRENHIHSLISEMSMATERAIAKAMMCFKNHDTSLAVEIISNDGKINELQREIENQCFASIALYQPVASDLRDLFSDYHTAVELERIADYAADIAKIVVDMDSPANPVFAQAISLLGEKCQGMLARVVQAYLDNDEQQARDIAAKDEEVDIAEKQIIVDILKQICNDPKQAVISTKTLWVVHCVERMGDRVTNIAERIVFNVSGMNVDLN